jgi:preprotein translocase subunit SecA
MAFFSKLFDSNQKQISKLSLYTEKVNALEDSVSKLSDDDIRSRISTIKKIGAKTIDEDIDKFIDEYIYEVFALTREASKRALNHRHFDVQILGGASLARGKLIELSTGEGKTLVATLALSLYALLSRGSHLVTVNDYLAKRDGEWAGFIYSFLGLSVGIITSNASYKFIKEDEFELFGKDINETKNYEKKLNGMHGLYLVECDKKEAYGCDITYGTNNDFGFDYLRDNLVFNISDTVQRELFYCIVDEADSVLIDEARTPLIISDPVESESLEYSKFANLAKSMNIEEDYIADEKTQSITLTEKGIDKIEKLLNLDDIWSNYSTTYHLENALKAKTFFIKDDEYLVKDGKVVIVDEFTGRLMPDRRFSEGLHQAIEAKEGVEILQESRNLATITFQNFFRIYKYLAGMTGTAITEAEEFYKIYKLDTVVIPTNMPNIRIDNPDRVYRNKDAKFNAVLEEIRELNKKGAPVLVGTTSVDTSEYLSNLLNKNGIAHNVLNAKYYEREAEIISHAGEKGQVTIATNMAGRGTDIALGEGVIELGGLHIIGTQRHESRRIDNQLRGRSGRQGDPGFSRFYVSMDDDLMRIFGGDSVARILGGLGISDDLPIESSIITRQIESAQKKVEAYNFDIRKSLVDYDDVMNKHREVIFTRRRKFLENMADKKFNYKDFVLEKVRIEVENIIVMYEDDNSKDNLDKILNDLFAIIPKELLETILIRNESNLEDWKKLIIKDGKSINLEVLKTQILLIIEEAFNMQKEVFTDKVFRQIVNDVYLQVLSFLWTDHIDAMNYLQQSIRLQGYAQIDPLVAYKQEAFNMFDRFIKTVDFQFVRRVFYVQKVEIENPITIDNSPQIEKNLDEEIKKIGRNDPCFCGSGKKYKNCHGKGK